MTYRAVDIGDHALVEIDPGALPVLQWMPLDALVIDDRYQRPLAVGNWRSIEAIASNFQWSRFAPILVAPVEDGRFAVIDGQHRAHAARLCGFTSVPASVVEITVAEQAQAFTWVNKQAIRVNHWEVFKAALAAGDDWAVRADAAVSASGCRLMTRNSPAKEKRAGQVYIVAFIRKQIEAGLDWAVTAGLTALSSIPQMQRPAAYTDYLLKPWINAVGDSGCRDAVLLRRVLMAEDPFKVISRAGGMGDGRHTLRAMIAQAEMAA